MFKFQERVKSLKWYLFVNFICIYRTKKRRPENTGKLNWVGKYKILVEQITIEETQQAYKRLKYSSILSNLTNPKFQRASEIPRETNKWTQIYKSKELVEWN